MTAMHPADSDTIASLDAFDLDALDVAPDAEGAALDATADAVDEWEREAAAVEACDAAGDGEGAALHHERATRAYRLACFLLDLDPDALLARRQPPEHTDR